MTDIANINDISKQLSVTADEEITLLEEYKFVNVFLPLFAGDEDRLYPQADLNTWANIAGGPYKKVRIINKNGKPLFDVPSLLDREIINPIDKREQSVVRVIHAANMFSRVHPNQGKQYLNDQLDVRAKAMLVPGSVIKNLDIWNGIFKRYGRPEIVHTSENKLEAESKISEDNFQDL